MVKQTTLCLLQKQASFVKHYKYLNSIYIYFRYPKDAYDREWNPRSNSGFNFINTSLSVNSSAPYELPRDVISKAVVNENVTENLSFYWSVDNRDYHALIYLHFAEIQTLQGNDTREFDIVWKGNDQNITVSSYRPPKLQLETLYNTPL